MDYRQLTDDESHEIRAQKLHAIEIDHARLTLDIELAARVGMTGGDSVDQARANLSILERQHADLLDIMSPPAPVEPSGNGVEPMPALSTPLAHRGA